MITIKPYNPVSTRETTHKDGLSARAIHDIANGCNAFKAYMPRVIINNTYPDNDCNGLSASVPEVVTWFAATRLMPGYRNLSFRIVHALKDVSYSNPHWYCYASAGIRDPSTLSLATGADYESDGIVVRHGWVSTSTTFVTELFALRTEGLIDIGQVCWIYLTVQSDDAYGAYGAIQSITCWQSGVIQ